MTYDNQAKRGGFEGRTYLKIAKLSELFPTVIEATEVRFALIVYNFMSLNITLLCEPLPANFTRV